MEDARDDSPIDAAAFGHFLLVQRKAREAGAITLVVPTRRTACGRRLNRAMRATLPTLKQRGVLTVNSIIYIVGLVVVVVAVLSFFGMR